jgi:hypothetical protein
MELMSVKKDLEDARKKVEKLHTYSAGTSAARGRDATKKYLELNSAADAAIKKLPRGLRSSMAVEFLGRKK